MDKPLSERFEGERLSNVKSLLPFSAVVATFAVLSTAAAQAAPPKNSIFDIDLENGLVLSAQIEAIDTSTGNWKPMTEKLEPMENGFNGSFVTAEGNDIQVQCKLGRLGEQVTGSISWESPEEVPSAFLLLTLIIPLDQVADATMVSGDQTISFEKMIAQIPTRNNFSGSNGFLLSPVSGETVEFVFDQASDVQALVLGENMYIRINLSPAKEPIPATGTAGWTVGKP